MQDHHRQPKRFRAEEDCDDMMAEGRTAGQTVQQPKAFLRLLPSQAVFHTFKFMQGETLYLPLTDEILVNVAVYDEISFSENVPALCCDERGNFSFRHPNAYLLHLWRIDGGQLVVARSFAFVHADVFHQTKYALLRLV